MLQDSVLEADWPRCTVGIISQTVSLTRLIASVDVFVMCLYMGVEGPGLLPWVGGPPDASFGLYLREAFQSQTNTQKILYNESR